MSDELPVTDPSHPSRRALLLGAGAAGATVVLAACGGDEREPAGSAGAAPDGRGDAPIRIGTKNFTEQYILGELYRQ
ncbi:MAG TPA: hypothetical protein VES42_16465, partial [Pilimelia sp.]|nr:hypothetical protein [Pilimelia sp.]